MTDIKEIKAAALAIKKGKWLLNSCAFTTNEVLELIERLEANEKDAARWNWLLGRMSGKDVAIFALRPAGRDDYSDDIVADLDKAMKENP